MLYAARLCRRLVSRGAVPLQRKGHHSSLRRLTKFFFGFVLCPTERSSSLDLFYIYLLRTKAWNSRRERNLGNKTAKRRRNAEDFCKKESVGRMIVMQCRAPSQQTHLHPIITSTPRHQTHLHPILNQHPVNRPILTSKPSQQTHTYINTQSTDPYLHQHPVNRRA